MIFLRPIQLQDLEPFIRLLHGAHLGLTSLPKDRALLEQKIIRSIQSFEKSVKEPHHELYFFVLEDESHHEMVGISAIEATTGGMEPLYFFRKESLHIDSPLSQVTKTIPVLSPVSYVRGPSEVCSLFLDPNYRGQGIGKLLSLSRFLFIAKFPERFTNSVVAELRGLIENDMSPFWEGIGKHFFNASLQDALDFLKYGRSFISHFLPKSPIFINLLPEAVQKSIGKTHPNTKAALNLLLQQGFEITDEIDVFDGGPKLRALKSEIHTLKISTVCQVVKIIAALPVDKEYLLSNERLDFRACIGSPQLLENGGITITDDIAKCLHIGLGDQIRISPLRNSSNGASLP